MSKKLHAQRNEKLCLTLNKEGEFYDWSVTTAFYAALHYVQFEIFPLTDGRRTFQTLDGYYNSIQGRKSSKHYVTIDLVYENIPDAGSKYKWLHDTCINARYHNYNVPKSVSDTSISYLNKIKEYLIK